MGFKCGLTLSSAAQLRHSRPWMRRKSCHSLGCSLPSFCKHKTEDYWSYLKLQPHYKRKPAVVAEHLAPCSYSHQKMSLFFPPPPHTQKIPFSSSHFHTLKGFLPCFSRLLVCSLLQKCVSWLPTVKYNEWIKRRVAVLSLDILTLSLSSILTMLWVPEYIQSSHLPQTPFLKQFISSAEWVMPIFTSGSSIQALKVL